MAPNIPGISGLPLVTGNNHVFPNLRIGALSATKDHDGGIARPSESDSRTVNENSGDAIPVNSNDEEDIEKILAKELQNLTVAEREEVYQDIHGVSEVDQEEPGFVQTSMNMLELELCKIEHQSKAFQMALQQSPRYVRDMYLMFLRCERFLYKSAAERMLRHFDFKLRLFGPDKLCKDITLHDFNEADLACLQVGFFQLLQTRDRAGRAVLLKTWYEMEYKEEVNVLRTIWYLKMLALKDVETQKNGLIAIIYNVCDTWLNKFPANLFRQVTQLLKSIPLRQPAIHYCYSDPSFGALISLITNSIERNARARTKLHRGSHMEVQYDLMSYGLPVRALPISSEGVMSRKDHLKWVRTRQNIEKRQEQQWQQQLQQQHCNGMYNNNNIMSLHQQQPILPAEDIIIPGRFDVILGRGKPLQNHIGNLRLTHLIEENLVRYTNVPGTKRHEKVANQMIIANEIISLVQMKNGRFLRQEKDAKWIRLDHKSCLEKVNHAFRNRKSQQRVPKTTNTTSTTGGVSNGKNKNNGTDVTTKPIAINDNGNGNNGGDGVFATPAGMPNGANISGGKRSFFSCIDGNTNDDGLLSSCTTFQQQRQRGEFQNRHPKRFVPYQG